MSSTANGGTPFGPAADRVQTVPAITPPGPLRRGRLDDAAASVLEQDFAARVI